MKKANQQKAAPAAIKVEGDGLMQLAAAVDPKAKEYKKLLDMKAHFTQLLRMNRNTVEAYVRLVEEYTQSIKENESDIEQIEREIARAEKPEGGVATGVLELIADMPWVQEVTVKDKWLYLMTRPGVLKTTLEKRMVCGTDPTSAEPEYLREPVVLDMPQYMIRINVNEYAGNISDKEDKLAIALVNQDDISDFDLRDSITHLPSAHWASKTKGFGQYAGLCLGRYQEDFVAAAKKGLVELIKQLPPYLQSCVDGHAYRSKEMWAFYLGKPGYKEHVYRLTKPGETLDHVKQAYRNENRRRNNIDFDSLPR